MALISNQYVLLFVFGFKLIKSHLREYILLCLKWKVIDCPHHTNTHSRTVIYILCKWIGWCYWVLVGAVLQWCTKMNETERTNVCQYWQMVVHELANWQQPLLYSFFGLLLPIKFIYIYCIWLRKFSKLGNQSTSFKLIWHIMTNYLNAMIYI